MNQNVHQWQNNFELVRLGIKNRLFQLEQPLTATSPELVEPLEPLLPRLRQLLVPLLDPFVQEQGLARLEQRIEKLGIQQGFLRGSPDLVAFAVAPLLSLGGGVRHQQRCLRDLRAKVLKHLE